MRRLCLALLYPLRFLASADRPWGWTEAELEEALEAIARFERDAA